jgi:hypothetical protein
LWHCIQPGIKEGEDKHQIIKINFCLFFDTVTLRVIVNIA